MDIVIFCMSLERSSLLSHKCATEAQYNKQINVLKHLISYMEANIPVFI